MISWDSAKKSVLQAVKKAPKSIWLFPAIVLLFLVLMTSLRLSGSSIGVYSMLNGVQDSDAIFAHPRGVRSDEWLVNTQMTVAQAHNDFRKVNEDIGKGQNMAFLDVPYYDWSTLFKPQNMAFFILPLEFAFAFKWWFMLAALLLASYFLALELFPRKILRSIAFSLVVGLSPMVFWWWSNGTFLTLAYSQFLAVLAIRLLKAGSPHARLGYSIAFAYVLSCFALILYPPFQVPCIITAFVFVVGWTLSYLEKPKLRGILRLWPYLLICILAPLLVGVTFYLTNKDAVKAITHTVYPGARVIVSGGTDPLLALSSFLAPNLQYDAKAAEGYFRNQSEASNFIFIAPFLFLPSLYLIIRERRRHKKLLWALLLINILLAVFLARMYLSTPWLEPLYKLMMLQTVPNSRLLFGAGMVGVLQILLLMKAMEGISFKKAELWAIALVGSLSGLATMLAVGAYTIDHYPVFIASFAKVSVYALWVAAGIFLILYKRFTAGLILLAAFSLMSVFRIHPIYQGLGSVTESATARAINAYPMDSQWVVLDDRLLINMPMMTGRHSLNAVNFYPQLSLWSELDKKGTYNNVYNRYAHVVFSDDPELTKPFELEYADMFYVKFDPCGSFLQKRKEIYVLAPKELSSSACVRLEKDFTTPAKHLYIYKIIPAKKQ